MNELGQLLREAREANGASLAEAEAQTRIRQKFIAAMEAEAWDALPNEVTARGFLRKYAAYLRLDEEAVLAQYQARSKAPALQPELTAPAEREADYRPIEMDLSHVERRSIPWGWIGAALVVVALVAAALYLYFYQPNFIANLTALPRSLPNPADMIALEPTATPTATVELNRVTATPTPTQPGQAATATPVATTGSAATTPAAIATVTDTPPTPAPGAQPVQQMALDFEVLARSWVRLMVDDRVVLESVLEPGQQGAWEASDVIVLRTGNAAGLFVRLNGQEYSELGGPGEVVELQWRLVDGQIVRVTATPVPPTPLPVTPEATPTATEPPTG